jgi:hypothetical protein
VRSNIDAATVAAYHRALYQVRGPAAFTLRIDQSSPELLAAHQQSGVGCSAFLTACNPYSRLLPDAENDARHAHLIQRLDALDFRHWPGFGADPEGRWPGETSVLVFGIAQQLASELGRHFEQNAIVWAGSEAVPRLLLLR